MADLSMFADDHFHLVMHPVANTYIPDIRPVWAEAFRVLRPGGVLMAGFFITGFYEDYDTSHPLARYLATHMATRATKPRSGGT